MKNHHPELRAAVWRMVLELLRAAHEVRFPKGNHFGADAEKILVYGAAVMMQLDGTPARASKIAQYLDLPNQTARRHLDKLVRWGLLERQRQVYTEGPASRRFVRINAVERLMREAVRQLQ
jgi:DNA-binding transcriptional ArsR family regulator